ncbi:hypothetical protein Tco_0895609 [Tanacetum coccineum]|uniref:Uncharacterized protein n=1 Tax=Tanacetum coccineum TaxID=301880 RepID=A0ABQ5CGL1_9ASTR
MFVGLTQDDTKTPSPKLPISSPSAPNAPSKTPSTKDTSSSSIDYIPKSPTSSTSPPPRVSPPPLTHENASMDITLTLSPITPLDVQFDTPSPSPPIVGHPIPWNLLEAHGDSCLRPFSETFTPTTHIHDSIQCFLVGIIEVTNQAKEIKHLKAQIKKLKKKAKPVITHHKAWMKSVSMKQRLAGKKSLKKQWMQKESVLYQGSYVVHKEKESAEKGVSTKDPLSTAQPKVSTDKPEDSTDKLDKDITEAKKKFKQLARDEEVARKVQEDWEAEEEMKRLAEEEATKVSLSNEYDFIQARLNADKILAKKLQKEERKRSIRNKPPSRNQLRNQMMTYLKHIEGKKHSDLKTKNEKVIKEINEQVADASKKRVKKDDSVKGELKEEEGTRKRKLGKRKKMKSKKRKFTSKDDEELRLCLTIAPDKDKEVDYEILDKKHPIIEWRFEYLTTKPQHVETEEIEDVYLNVVIRSNRQRRYFSTLMNGLLLDEDCMDACGVCILELKAGTVILHVVEEGDLLKEHCLMRSNVKNGNEKGLGVD